MIDCRPARTITRTDTRTDTRPAKSAVPSLPASRLRVWNVLTRNPVCVTGDTSTEELARILDANGISGAAVLDAADHVVGVVSKTDVLHRCVEDVFETDSLLPPSRAWATAPFGVVSDYMDAEPITATPDEPLDVVAQRLAHHGVHRVVVVDGERCVVGILTTMDMVRALAGRP